jgi:N-acyl-L-homoserine lactone synthetase
MIEYVTLSNIKQFRENPIIEQHRLRYRSIILRQNWDVPNYDGLEFDQYDNPATKYLVYRDVSGSVRGVSRLYPTTLPYMLEEKFSHFITTQKIPKDPNVWEGSRFCVDHTLPAEMRKRIINEIVVSYLETGIKHNIKAIVGLMYPAYWRSIFIKAGWNIDFMGDVIELNDGNKARSAWLPVSEKILSDVRKTTGINEKITNFGERNEKDIAQAA